MPTTVSAMVATRPNAVSLASRLPPPPNDDCPVSLSRHTQLFCKGSREAVLPLPDLPAPCDPSYLFSERALTD